MGKVPTCKHRARGTQRSVPSPSPAPILSGGTPITPSTGTRCTHTAQRITTHHRTGTVWTVQHTLLMHTSAMDICILLWVHTTMGHTLVLLLWRLEMAITGTQLDLRACTTSAAGTQQLTPISRVPHGTTEPMGWLQELMVHQPPRALMLQSELLWVLSDRCLLTCAALPLKIFSHSKEKFRLAQSNNRICGVEWA